MPRGAAPFKVLYKINDNSYKIELLGNYVVSPIFNVIDLSPFFCDEVTKSRMTPFQQREDDVDIPTKHTISTKKQGPGVPSNINQGTLTRSDEDINTPATIIPSIEILGPIT
jgi:hypothetical protein